MTSNYKKAYTEVLEILSHLSKEEIDKIPKEKIDYYKENMDVDYAYHIDPQKPLDEQYISSEANAILVTLFRDYFANESQKDVLKKMLDLNHEILERVKKEKYNANDIFKNN